MCPTSHSRRCRRRRRTSLGEQGSSNSKPALWRPLPPRNLRGGPQVGDDSKENRAPRFLAISDQKKRLGVEPAAAR